MKANIVDKVRGSIMGGACGDALGYTVEFVGSFRELKARYGEAGITAYDTDYYWLGDSSEGRKALFSDDTQMTLYTAEGILEAEKSGREIIPMVRDAYLAWYGGQVGCDVNIAYDSQLASISEFNQRRAPGSTCLSALRTASRGHEPHNDSKGCGGIMRVAPVGLYGAAQGWSLGKIARLAGDAAELTHLHPLSTYSSAALAVIVALCVPAEDMTVEEFRKIIEKAMEAVEIEYGEDAPLMPQFKRCVANAVALSNDARSDWEIIEYLLGGGWVAEETLAISLFSVLRHIDDFRACLVCAVNHGGDSDSTGAVAGNIIGAILGYDSLPNEFTEGIQLRELLLSTADSLAAVSPGN